MANADQIRIWKESIKVYKEIYTGLYPGKRPSDKLIGAFCDIQGIPWPLPDVEEEFDFLN